MDLIRLHPLVFAALLAVLVIVGATLGRLRQRLIRSEQERRRAAEELNRRLSELFSLQELSYVLSDSLELDRIVEQVVRYAVRFLDAQGALLALVGDTPGEPIQIAAAEGTLSPLRGRRIAGDDPGLVARSTGRDHLELVRNSGGSAEGSGGPKPTPIVAGFEAVAAAAVPLRSHGAVIGTLIITDPRQGQFEPEDVRLLSTLATHAAVVIANARFFEMVRRAKEQWETAFDALSEGIAVVDTDGVVRRANRSLASLLGVPVSTLVGTPLGDALLGKSQALAELLAGTRRGERVAPLVARSERLQRTVRVNAALITGAAFEQSVVVLVEDVTDQQALETQLVQSEKLAAVGQLVSGVAHELNNPLTSIVGLSEFLLEQKELGKKDRGHLQVIQEQAERAGRIVRNLLTFARQGTGERALVDLNDVIRRTLSLTAYDLKLKDVMVTRELSGALPGVLGDRHGLQQVVLNLITNAAQAVAENPRDRPREITVSTWFDGQVHLRVADSGPGIPDAVVQSVFTPFFTTKEPGKGTGLGLSITYSIVESHGGHITVESRPAAAGSGASFRVDLPPAPPDVVAQAMAPAAAQSPGSSAGGQFVKRTILLVDGDPAVQRTIKALFARDGHDVEVAGDPQHALDLAQRGSFDLVIIDARAMAPGKRGVLLAEELVAKLPALRERIIVATGDVRPATEETLARLGVRYVRKPFNLRDLRVEAARLWEATALS
ncbi:MAG TPA: ATP-binding protein [Gemmatimonadales bacterium]|nr:ATP-binding protein [Gemmatimonadales bacterium]